MADDEEPLYDVAVNVMKDKANGYGIYFNCSGGKIKVTKLDKGSEAERAGVQANDELVSVQDNDKKFPAESPGKKMVVCAENYQAVLNNVRQMNYCRLEFKAPGFGS